MKGTGYYRFVSSAGTQMPEEAPGFMQCGTAWAGWMRGQHPGTMFIIDNSKLYTVLDKIMHSILKHNEGKTFIPQD